MAEDKPTWTVVQFIDDGTVEAVPSSWVQKDECYWPTFPPQKLHMAIKKNEPLNTHWPSHKVKSFRKATYDDYFKARTKSKVAEDTSELNTDSDSEAKKRKRIQRILSSSGSGDELEETLLPMAPKIIRKKTDIKEVKMETENRKKTKFGEIIRSSTNRSESPFEILETSTQAEPTQSENVNNRNVTCRQCTERDKNLKSITQQIHILRGLVTEILCEVKTLKQNFQAKESLEIPRRSFFQNEDITFPISDDNDFQMFENYLENEAEFHNAIQELSKLGGSNIYDYIKRAFKLTLTNEQALKYSWLGMKGNRKFVETNLAKLLLRSAEATGIAQNQKEIEIAIQTWLRRASDRRATTMQRKN